MPVTQLPIVPTVFLSGALFPVSGLPDWLAVLTRRSRPSCWGVVSLAARVFRSSA